METIVPLQHANTQGKTYQQKVRVLLKAWAIAQRLHIDCVNGRETGGKVWCKQGYYCEDNFLDKTDANRKWGIFMFSTGGITQRKNRKPDSWTTGSKSLHQPKVSCGEPDMDSACGGWGWADRPVCTPERGQRWNCFEYLTESPVIINISWVSLSIPKSSLLLWTPGMYCRTEPSSFGS